ncbi:MAG: DNA-3-methyladenine glycosylase 2 family protein [Pseudomonadota bacterium]
MTAPSGSVLRQACDVLAARDDVLAKAYHVVDLPNWRATEASYQSLARIVVYQLISTKAADAIWARICARYKSMTARAVLDDDEQALLKCGLSRPKLGHLRAIAEAVESGVLNLAQLAAMEIEDARQSLLAVRGIGPWTADTFLMNAVGHLDAFPHGDVGLMESYKRLTDAPERLASKAFSQRAENWRPYRAVAAHLLYDWLHFDRAEKL